MSSVKVAVRVRPFNDREVSMNAVLCISMEGKATTIENKDEPNSKNNSRTFSFDYSYWSHDGFQADDAGYCHPVTPQYADQQRVYDDIGKDVLNNAFEGYNACLFAYGQTGAGKSYSMVGYGANKGIVVRACEEIFDRIHSRSSDPNVRSEVCVSMLEIYNEQVQDLLTPINKRPKGGLKIRHTPQLGTFVQDLSKNPVNSYDEIQAKLDEGTANRTVGATLMNATSSRAHTVLQISFRQVTVDPGTGEPVSQKCSEINLVDLAGSERAGSTGATGDRLKEGCAINQSLTSLGKVISALADKAAGKLKPGQVIPYRDSALTRILQTALGGNSKTCMIAALSPASVNYEETMSTLRYADRVKQIKNEAVVNENPLEKLIRELREENERLKKAMGGELPMAGVGVDEAAMEAMRKQFEEEIEANKRAMEEMTMSWQQKVEAAQAAAASSGGGPSVATAEELTRPVLMNLNEDPFLSGKIVCVLRDGENVFGKADEENKPDFRIGGLGVIPNHAVLTVKETKGEDDDESVFVVLLTASGTTSVNGDAIPAGESKQLNHRDRVLFGHNNLYVFMDPSEMDRSLPLWDECIQEIKKESLGAYGPGGAQGGADAAETAELEKKYKEKLKKLETEHEKFVREKKRLLRELKDKEALLLASEEDQQTQQEELQLLHEEKLQVERELELKEHELEAQQQQLQLQQEEEVKRMEAEKAAKLMLQEVMTRTMLLIDEANMIAQELGVGVFFSPKLSVKSDALSAIRGSIAASAMMQKTEIVIRVDRMNSDLAQLWSLDLFERKIFEMRELYAAWTPKPGEKFQVPPGVPDPFASDPESYQVLGQTYLYLETIRHLLPVEKEPYPIIDSKGRKIGTLILSVLISLGPKVDSTIEEDELAARRVEDLDDYSSIDDVLGRQIDVQVIVHSVNEIPEKFSRHPQVVYRWVDGMKEVSMVSPDEGGKETRFNNSREFTLIANETTKEWLSGVLVFEVSGKFLDKRSKGHGGGSSKSDEIKGLQQQLQQQQLLLQHLDALLNQRGQSLPQLLSEGKEKGIITASDVEAAQAATRAIDAAPLNSPEKTTDNSQFASPSEKADDAVPPNSEAEQPRPEEIAMPQEDTAIPTSEPSPQTQEETSPLESPKEEAPEGGAEEPAEEGAEEQDA